VTIEQGVLAVIGLLWAWLLFGAALWRAMKRPWTYAAPAARGDLAVRHEWRGKYVALAAAAAALLIIVVHGMLDDALYGSRGVLLLFLPLAFAVPLLRPSDEATRQHNLATAVAVAGLAILAAVAGRSLGAGILANLAAVEQSRLELGRYSWPEWGVQDELRRQIDLRPVMNRYEQALGLNPRHGSANRRLGQIELSLGDYERALAHLNEAYHRAPTDNTTRQLLGEAYAANGRVSEATTVWQTVETGQQRLQLRQYWYASIGDQRREQNVAAVLTTLGY
jgi:tetratricopeptide (TPR) repeat protein